MVEKLLRKCFLAFTFGESLNKTFCVDKINVFQPESVTSLPNKKKSTVAGKSLEGW